MVNWDPACRDPIRQPQRSVTRSSCETQTRWTTHANRTGTCRSGSAPILLSGAPLARLEGQVAIGTLLNRLPDLRLAVDSKSLRWRRGLVLRGLKALPVAFTKT